MACNGDYQTLSGVGYISEMDESLKAARLLHQLIVAVAATVGIICLNPAPQSSDFSAAASELEDALKVVQDTAEFLLNERRRVYAESGMTDAFRQLLGRDVAIVPEPADAPLTVTPKTYVFEVYNLLTDGLNRRETLQTVTPGAIKRENIEGDFLDRLATDSQNFAEVKVSWATDGRTDGTGTFSLAVNGNAGLVLSPLRAKTINIEWGDYLRRRADSLQLLVHSDNSRIDALPHLRKVWVAVGQLDVGAARLALINMDQERKEQREARFNLAGFEVRARLAAIVAPLLLLALDLYLLAHVQHIRQRQTAPITDFPWLPLFEGRLGAVLSYASLLILPSSITVYLIYLAPFSAVSRLAGSIAFVGIFVPVSVAILRGARAIRRPHSNKSVADLSAAAPF